MQDELHLTRGAKSVPRHALGPELSCCLQDGVAAACGPEASVAGGCGLQRQDVARDTVSNNRDCECAICAGYPCIPRGTRGRQRSSLCDIRCAAVAGTPARRRPAGGVGTSTAGSSSGNTGNAFHPYGRCRTTHNPEPRDLETGIECLPRPRQWVSPDYITRQNAVVLSRG